MREAKKQTDVVFFFRFWDPEHGWFSFSFPFKPIPKKGKRALKKKTHSHERDQAGMT